MKHSEITKLSVLSIDSGENLGKIVDLVIDGDNGQCLALLVRPEGFLTARKITLIDDVSEFGADAVMVQSKKMLVPYKNNEDLKQVVSKGAKIINNKVITHSGDLLGEVRDFVVSEETNKLSQLLVSTGLIKDLLKGELIIAANKIISIGEDAIVVKDAVVKEKSGRARRDKEKEFAQLGVMNKNIKTGASK